MTTRKPTLAAWLLLFLAGACSPASYFGVKNNAWYVPSYFSETQSAIAAAEKSQGAVNCPEQIAKANELAKQGAQSYWDGHPRKAEDLLAQARQTARDAEACQPPPAPAAPAEVPPLTPPPPAPR